MPSTHLLLLSMALQTCLSRVSCGSVQLGGACLLFNDRIDLNSHHFLSDCDDRTFCSNFTLASSTLSSNSSATLSSTPPLSSSTTPSSNIVDNSSCISRLCRRDEFPFGWRTGDPNMPPLCPKGTFCPDEGSGCKSLVDVGGACQMNRDEQCLPPPPAWNISSTCLVNTCMYANVSLGQTCIIDHVLYTDFNTTGYPITNTVMRDNCVTDKFYCDESDILCKPLLALQASCSSDRECDSKFCGPNDHCAEPPETPARVLPWHFAVTIITVVAALVATCIMLSLVHKRHHLESRRVIREYYYQQMDLRRSMIAIRIAAVNKTNKKA